MSEQVDATARLVIFLAYLAFSFWTLFSFISLFRIRVAWKKLWDYPGYCLDQNTWADLKAELGKKLDGRSIERNKEHVHRVLGLLMKHELYRTVSRYNLELPEQLKHLQSADSMEKFEAIRKEMLNTFSHTEWSSYDQMKAIYNAGIFPMISAFVWVAITVVLRNSPI